MPQFPGGPLPHRLPGVYVDHSTASEWRCNDVTEDFVKAFMHRSKSTHQTYISGDAIAAKLALCLQSRDAHLQWFERFHLWEAYNTKEGQAWRKGVYVFVHTTLPMMYVGSWYKTGNSCVHNRGHSHLTAANACCKHPARYMQQPVSWRPSADAVIPKGLYNNWIMFGLQDWYMFPLEMLPSYKTSVDVLECEQKWIVRLQTMEPFGSNAVAANKRIAFRNTHLQLPWCPTRVYGCRDMCRRVYVCYRACMYGHLDDANCMHFFQKYQYKTLVRMHTFCRMGTDGESHSAVDIIYGWQVPLNLLQC